MSAADHNTFCMALGHWDVHDTLVHFYIVLILMGIGVDVGVRVSVYFFRGKLIIVVDEAHHISVSIRDKFVISINLSPY